MAKFWVPRKTNYYMPATGVIRDTWRRNLGASESRQAGVPRITTSTQMTTPTTPLWAQGGRLGAEANIIGELMSMPVRMHEAPLRPFDEIMGGGLQEGIENMWNSAKNVPVLGTPLHLAEGLITVFETSNKIARSKANAAEARVLAAVANANPGTTLSQAANLIELGYLLAPSGQEMTVEEFRDKIMAKWHYSDYEQKEFTYEELLTRAMQDPNNFGEFPVSDNGAYNFIFDMIADPINFIPFAAGAKFGVNMLKTAKGALLVQPVRLETAAKVAGDMTHIWSRNADAGQLIQVARWATPALTLGSRASQYGTGAARALRGIDYTKVPAHDAITQANDFLRRVTNGDYSLGPLSVPGAMHVIAKIYQPGYARLVAPRMDQLSHADKILAGQGKLRTGLGMNPIVARDVAWQVSGAAHMGVMSGAEKLLGVVNQREYDAQGVASEEANGFLDDVQDLLYAVNNRHPLSENQTFMMLGLFSPWAKTTKSIGMQARNLGGLLPEHMVSYYDDVADDLTRILDDETGMGKKKADEFFDDLGDGDRTLGKKIFEYLVDLRESIDAFAEFHPMARMVPQTVEAFQHRSGYMMDMIRETVATRRVIRAFRPTSTAQHIVDLYKLGFFPDEAMRMVRAGRTITYEQMVKYSRDLYNSGVLKEQMLDRSAQILLDQAGVITKEIIGGMLGMIDDLPPDTIIPREVVAMIIEAHPQLLYHGDFWSRLGFTLGQLQTKSGKIFDKTATSAEGVIKETLQDHLYELLEKVPSEEQLFREMKHIEKRTVAPENVPGIISSRIVDAPKVLQQMADRAMTMANDAKIRRDQIQARRQAEFNKNGQAKFRTARTLRGAMGSLFKRQGDTNRFEKEPPQMVLKPVGRGAGGVDYSQIPFDRFDDDTGLVPNQNIVLPVVSLDGGVPHHVQASAAVEVTIAGREYYIYKPAADPTVLNDTMHPPYLLADGYSGGNHAYGRRAGRPTGALPAQPGEILSNRNQDLDPDRWYIVSKKGTGIPQTATSFSTARKAAEWRHNQSPEKVSVELGDDGVIVLDGPRGLALDGETGLQLDPEAIQLAVQHGGRIIERPVEAAIDEVMPHIQTYGAGYGMAVKHFRVPNTDIPTMHINALPDAHSMDPSLAAARAPGSFSQMTVKYQVSSSGLVNVGGHYRFLDRNSNVIFNSIDEAEAFIRQELNRQIQVHGPMRGRPGGVRGGQELAELGFVEVARYGEETVPPLIVRSGDEAQDLIASHSSLSDPRYIIRAQTMESLEHLLTSGIEESAHRIGERRGVLFGRDYQSIQSLLPPGQAKDHVILRVRKEAALTPEERAALGKPGHDPLGHQVSEANADDFLRTGVYPAERLSPHPIHPKDIEIFTGEGWRPLLQEQKAVFAYRGGDPAKMLANKAAGNYAPYNPSGTRIVKAKYTKLDRNAVDADGHPNEPMFAAENADEVYEVASGPDSYIFKDAAPNDPAKPYRVYTQQLELTGEDQPMFSTFSEALSYFDRTETSALKNRKVKAKATELHRTDPENDVSQGGRMWKIEGWDVDDGAIIVPPMTGMVDARKPYVVRIDGFPSRTFATFEEALAQFDTTAPNRSAAIGMARRAANRASLLVPTLDDTLGPAYTPGTRAWNAAGRLQRYHELENILNNREKSAAVKKQEVMDALQQVSLLDNVSSVDDWYNRASPTEVNKMIDLIKEANAQYPSMRVVENGGIYISPTTDRFGHLMTGRSLMRRMLYDHGPLAPIRYAWDALFAPKNSQWLAQKIGHEMNAQLRMVGATVEEVDKFMKGVQTTVYRSRSPMGLGGHVGSHLFRNARSIPEGELRGIVEDAMGNDKLDLLLERFGSIQNMVTEAAIPVLRRTARKERQGGKVSKLEAAANATARFWQYAPGLTSASDVTHMTTKFLYPLLRFLTDPRFLTLNLIEPYIYGISRMGIKEAMRKPGAFEEGLNERIFTEATKRGMGPSGLRPTAGEHIATEMLLMDHGTFLLPRNIKPMILKDHAMTRRRYTEELLNDMRENDPLALMFQERFGTMSKQEWVDKIEELAYGWMNDGAEGYTARELKMYFEEFGFSQADMEKFAPFSNRLIDLARGTANELTDLYVGRMNRSFVERLGDNFWLFWPLSYQIKATMWMGNIMFNRIGPVKTGATGAFAYQEYRERFMRSVEADPEFAAWLQDNRDFMFLFEMMFPMTPEGVGVASNKLTRIGASWINANVFQSEEIAKAVGDYSYVETVPEAIGSGLTVGIARSYQMFQRIANQLNVPGFTPPPPPGRSSSSGRSVTGSLRGTLR